MGRKLNVRLFLSPNKSSTDVITLSTITAAISTRAFALMRTGRLLARKPKIESQKRWSSRSDSTTSSYGATVPHDLSATRYLDNTSTARGKPSIVVEAGYAGVVEADDIALLVDGTLSTMRALKMLSGEPRPIENPVWLDRVGDVLSDGPGIWYPLVKHGTYVQEGMKIGFVTD